MAGKGIPERSRRKLALLRLVSERIASFSQFFEDVGVFGFVGEIGGFVGVVSEVVELLVVEFDITGVFVLPGSEGFGFGDCGVWEEVFVEEVGSPFRVLAAGDGDEGAALHSFWDGD